MLGWQKSCSPVDDATRGQSSFVRKNHKRGQIIRFATQSVSHPGPHAGKPGQDLTSVHHEVTGAVQGGFTLHRINEGHVVHTGSKLGEQITHPDT